MILLKLAFKNITHAGMRTWLNVIVLSIALVTIVVTEGLYDGVLEQVKDNEIDSNVGGGQFWQKNYDPYDLLSVEVSHSEIPESLNKEIEKGNAIPILIVVASIFPRHQIQSVRLKGIDPNQSIIKLPSPILKTETDTHSIPGLIGLRMSKNTGLQTGDYVSVRWRNRNGTYDAGEITIMAVVETNTPLTDKDQVWVPLEKLREMMLAPGRATIITLKKDINAIPANCGDWVFKNQDYLLKDFNENISRKKVYSTFFYFILIGMALLAVFDTQVLSIFKRRKEIGTLMALGMEKWNVIFLFAFEGCITGIIALIVGSLYGFPLLTYLAKEGIALPRMIQQSQFAIGLKLYPKYELLDYVVASLIILVSVIIVSFLSTHRITKMNLTDALKGKI